MRIALATVVLAGTMVAPGASQSVERHPIEIPLDIQEGRFVVPVEAADGTQLRFALSGNPMTIFSESTAALLGEDPALSMGAAAVDTDGAVTLPDERLAAGATTLDGMIGSKTLSQYDVLIDAPNERLVLRPIGRPADWPGVALSDPVSLRILHGVILSFDVELNDVPYRATLDLGMPTLMVNAPVLKKSQLEDEDVAALGLGGTVHPDLPVKRSDLEMFGRWDPDNQGFVYVGGPLAYDCAVSISWVHRELRTCVR
jgi:hypothetical protein